MNIFNVKHKIRDAEMGVYCVTDCSNMDKPHLFINMIDEIVLQLYYHILLP